MKRRAFAPVARGVAIASVLAAPGCGEADPDANPVTTPPAATVDDGPSGAKRPPPHAFGTLEGGEIGLESLEGRVAVVNFWGTWCLPCRRELPELVELAEAYDDQDVAIVGIAVDSGSATEIRTFLSKFGVEYPIWLSGMEPAVSKFGALGFPFTLVIDRDGWIRKEYLGPQTYDSLASEIDALLE
ncbi:MAG: TlpA family protein disulfide reductase [Gemmatimonadetes bacterium]|nr:TlpA family protein disulfide reductase [Gemmatimonadota bacterium]